MPVSHGLPWAGLNRKFIFRTLRLSIPPRRFWILVRLPRCVKRTRQFSPTEKRWIPDFRRGRFHHFFSRGRGPSAPGVAIVVGRLQNETLALRGSSSPPCPPPPVFPERERLGSIGWRKSFWSVFSWDALFPVRTRPAELPNKPRDSKIAPGIRGPTVEPPRTGPETSPPHRRNPSAMNPPASFPPSNLGRGERLPANIGQSNAQSTFP